MEDETRERLAEDLRSVASDVQKLINAGRAGIVDQPTVELWLIAWHNKLLRVAHELDPVDVPFDPD